MDNNTCATGLFCFDGPIYKDVNGYYCSTTLTDEMFNRFFPVVDKLYVVIRCFKCDKTFKELNMKRLCNKKIIVIEVDNLLTIKGLLFKKAIFEKKVKAIVDKSDLIFARMPSIISNVVLKEALKLNKPYLVEVGGCAWDSFWNHGIKGKILAPIMFFWEKKYVHKADFAIYVTEQFLQHRYPNNKNTTNCSNVYLESFDEEVLNERLRRINNMDFSRPILGQTVASIDVKYKGEQYVIRALKDLKKIGIHAEYQIVGPGEGAFLKKQAKKNGVTDQVVFLGAKEKEEVFSWLQSIDIYVQPSKQEGLPRAVIEAMSVGCPAIGSNIAGIPELLERDCLFNPNNNQQVVSCIINTLNKKNMSKYAQKNFFKAKKYNINDIEARRQLHFTNYKAAVDNRKMR